MSAWQLLLVFWAVCLLSMFICTFCNQWLPHVDSEFFRTPKASSTSGSANKRLAFCAAWTALSIVVILTALSVKADVGRHSPSFSLGNYDTSFSGMVRWCPNSSSLLTSSRMGRIHLLVSQHASRFSALHAL